MNIDVHIFLRFVVIFSEFFKLSIKRFARIPRNRSETPRAIRLSGCQVGGRDLSFNHERNIKIVWNNQYDIIYPKFVPKFRQSQKLSSPVP